MKKYIFIISLVIFSSIALNASADILGEKRTFYIESSYDSFGREEIRAILVSISSNLYFYIDENWWYFIPQNEIHQVLSGLGQEFEDRTYPILTSTFGPEWNPGIDKDSRITVLIHPMRENAGGYFSTKDEYSKLQVTNSNEREMIYLNSKYIKESYAKAFLAHEFVHLITFNQKENTYDITEETWLNEARAEYAPTFIGYDDDYEQSNLKKRVQIFSENPSDSIVGWQSKKDDYGALNLFTQYLVDHYGIEILVNSLQSSKIGIESINYALAQNGFEQDFSQIFLDWAIAVLVNDCNYGSKYCYLNENLRNVFVVPKTNFLPLTGQSALSVVEITKNWTGNWYKIIGGTGNLELEFSSVSASYFTVPYILKKRNGSYIIDFLEIDNSRGEIYVEDFGKDIIALYIIPVVNKIDGGSFYSFSWTASTVEEQQDSELIHHLLTQIETLTAEIAKIQAQINAILASSDQDQDQNQGDQNQDFSCQRIENNLYYGLMNNQEVRCLQEFLKSQGSEIYPEGLVTANFLSLTKAAAIRFQEKYASDILGPWDLTKGTGFVGETTRTKINQLLGT